MACCHQATSHYLSQCWPGSMSLFGITRPQWIKYIAQYCQRYAVLLYICLFQTHFMICYLEHLLWNSPLVKAQDITDDKSTLVEVMALWYQATSHYLKQRWPIRNTVYLSVSLGRYMLCTMHDGIAFYMYSLHCEIALADVFWQICFSGGFLANLLIFCETGNYMIQIWFIGKWW